MLDPMEFQDVVRRRKMVRDYATDPVDPAIVDLALRNAVRAPNAGFSQGWGFLVLDEPADVRRFWELTTDPEDLAGPDAWLTGMMHAPVVVVPCSSKAAYLKRYAQPDKGWTDEDEARWPVPFWHIDTGMAALLILQTVTDAGLGACYFGIPPERVECRARRLRDPGDLRPDRRDHHRPPDHDRRAAGLPERAAAQGAGGRRPPRALGLNLGVARPQSTGRTPPGQRASPAPGLASETLVTSAASGQ